MAPLSSRLARARRALAAHRDHLRDTLATLAGRLREAVAQALGGTAASAVREAVHALIVEEAAHVAPPVYRPPPYRASPVWGEPRDYPREDDPDDDPPEDWSETETNAWREVEHEDPPVAVLADEPRRFRWHRALAVGCQAAAWWLRRQASGYAALVALGIGLVATGAALVTSTVLTESALGLLTLADAVPPRNRAPSYVDTR